MTILVGCSGWSYEDWVGRFYPIEMAMLKGKWFAYYAEYFETVEINSTFYRPPNEFQVRSWIKKAKDMRGFEYSIKVPQLVTHKSMVDRDIKRATFWANSFEKTCVKPLAAEGLLGSVLLQLSPYFKNDSSAQGILKDVLDSISYDKYDYAVEFRHRSWLSKSEKEIDSTALEILKEKNIANVLVDGPGLPESNKQTADHVYVRFHGRNYDIWFKGDKHDHRLDRYDYLYKQEQLDPWIPRLKNANLKTTKVRVYFNNHARAKSVRNAFLLMDMLQIEHKSKEIQLQDQFTLEEF